MENYAGFALVKEKIIKTDELLTRYSTVNAKFKKIKLALNNLQVQHGQTCIDNNRLLEDNKRLTFSVNSVSEELSKVQSKNEQLKLEYTELERKYGQQVNEFQKNYQELEDEIKEYKSKLSKFDENDAKSKLTKKFNNELKKNENFVEQCRSLKTDIDQVKKEKAALILKNKEYEDAISILKRNLIERDEMVTEIANLKEEINVVKLKAELDAIEKNNSFEETIRNLRSRLNYEKKTVEVQTEENLSIQFVEKSSTDTQTENLLFISCNECENRRNIPKANAEMQTPTHHYVNFETAPRKNTATQTDTELRSNLYHEAYVNFERVPTKNTVETPTNLECISIFDLDESKIIEKAPTKTQTESTSIFDFDESVNVKMSPAKNTIETQTDLQSTSNFSHDEFVSFEKFSTKNAVETQTDMETISNIDLDDSASIKNTIETQTDLQSTSNFSHDEFVSFEKFSTKNAVETQTDMETVSNIVCEESATIKTTVETQTDLQSICNFDPDDFVSFEMSSTKNTVEIQTDMEIISNFDHDEYLNFEKALTKNTVETQTDMESISNFDFDEFVNFEKARPKNIETNFERVADENVSHNTEEEDIQIRNILEEMRLVPMLSPLSETPYTDYEHNEEIIKDKIVTTPETNKQTVHRCNEDSDNGIHIDTKTESSTLSHNNEISKNDTIKMNIDKYNKRRAQKKKSFIMRQISTHSNKRNKRFTEKERTKKHKKRDMLLQALLVLKKSNINFTISNNTVPSNYHLCSVLPRYSQNLPDMYHTTKLECCSKKCNKDSYMLLNRGTIDELLGFFEVKDELKTPCMSRLDMSCNDRNLNLRQPQNNSQFIDDIVERVSKKMEDRMKQNEGSTTTGNYSRNSFQSETEPELEALFKKTANSLSSNNEQLFCSSENSNEVNFSVPHREESFKFPHLLSPLRDTKLGMCDTSKNHTSLISPPPYIEENQNCNKNIDLIPLAENVGRSDCVTPNSYVTCPNLLSPLQSTPVVNHQIKQCTNSHAKMKLSTKQSLLKKIKNLKKVSNSSSFSNKSSSQQCEESFPSRKKSKIGNSEANLSDSNEVPSMDENMCDISDKYSDVEKRTSRINVVQNIIIKSSNVVNGSNVDNVCDRLKIPSESNVNDDGNGKDNSKNEILFDIKNISDKFSNTNKINMNEARNDKINPQRKILPLDKIEIKSVKVLQPLESVPQNSEKVSEILSLIDSMQEVPKISDEEDLEVPKIDSPEPKVLNQQLESSISSNSQMLGLKEDQNNFKRKLNIAEITNKKFLGESKNEVLQNFYPEVSKPSQNSDKVSEILSLMQTRNPFKKELSQTTTPNIAAVHVPKIIPEQSTSNFNESMDCPKSPEPEVFNEDEALLKCRIIPLQRPPKLHISQVAKLFKKLISYPNEQKVLDEVVRRFLGQDGNFVARMVLATVSEDIHDEAIKSCNQAPLLTDTQKTLFGFMLKLEAVANEPILDNYLTEAENKLFSEGIELQEIQPITRLYLAICKMRKDINRIRRLVCEAFYFCGDFAIPIFFTVLVSWFDVLPLEVNSKDFPMAKVLVQLVNTKDCNKPGYNLSNLRLILSQYFKYPKERLNNDEVFEEIFNNYLRKPERLSDFAILIFCKNQSHKWLMKMIEEKIKPLILKIPHENFKANVIILLGNICHSIYDFKYINEIRKWMLECLTDDSTSDLIKQSIQLSIGRLPKPKMKNKQ